MTNKELLKKLQLFRKLNPKYNLMETFPCDKCKYCERVGDDAKCEGMKTKIFHIDKFKIKSQVTFGWGDRTNSWVCIEWLNCHK
jgi:hypothetical protein